MLKFKRLTFHSLIESDINLLNDRQKIPTELKLVNHSSVFLKEPSRQECELLIECFDSGGQNSLSHTLNRVFFVKKAADLKAKVVNTVTKKTFLRQMAFLQAEKGLA